MVDLETDINIRQKLLQKYNLNDDYDKLKGEVLYTILEEQSPGHIRWMGELRLGWLGEINAERRGDRRAS